MSDLKWGTDAWRTHLRRSLAQRKRHGEKIDDIEGLINYIEAKGPSKAEETISKKRTDHNKPQPRQQSPKKVVQVSGQKIVSAPAGESGTLFKAPVILRGR